MSSAAARGENVQVAAIDALPVGDAMKGELASKALANRAWNDPALVNAARDVLANQAMQTQIAVLGNVLKPENLANLLDDDIFNCAEFFTTAVNNALANAIPQERRAEMAGDNPRVVDVHLGQKINV